MAAEAPADLGPRLGLSPATPDIVRKRARSSWTSCADGSCCTALFTSTVPAPVAGPGKLESDGFAPVVSPVQKPSQSVPEDLRQQVYCAPASTHGSSSALPLLVGESSYKIAQQDQQKHQREGGVAGNGSDVVPTPKKVEPPPRRLWNKKSTKGKGVRLRFKVVKDKVMEPKMANKRGRQRKGTPTGASSCALVPLWDSSQLTVNYGGHEKVLPNETLRVSNVLAKWDRSDSESFEGFDIGSGPEWEQERGRLKQLVDIFISEVSDLLGPRKFSPWGGSLIDSVVGTFLTQNAADNLSSHAFMNLAAKFPPMKRCHKAEVDHADENLNSNKAYDSFDSIDSHFDEYTDSEEQDGHDTEAKGRYGQEYYRLIESLIGYLQDKKDISTWNDSDLMNLVKDKSGNPIRTEKTIRRFGAVLRAKPVVNWKKLREEACQKGYSSSDRSRTDDAVDWEAVLQAPIAEVAKCIKDRGQHYILALRIQVFLKRVNIAQDGSFDLDWLRYISREKANIHGIGVKSAGCIRLLSLRHKAFPVDVNVARIVTRLGWVELKPLNGAEFHLVNSYPIMPDVQRYLWPRLCTIDKEKLYELHCLMITFGKVMCTKINPNCSACPFSVDCKYYNSSFASHFRLQRKHEHGHGEQQSRMVASGRFLLSNGSMYQQHQIEIRRTAETPPIHCACTPIIEMPQSPEYDAPNEQEDSYKDNLCDIEDIVPGVQYNGEIDLRSKKHVLNNRRSWTPKCGMDLVVINPKSSFGPNKNLKNVGRLRTEHNAYVLPDDHVILKKFEKRLAEDICPYLLVVNSCSDDKTVTGTVMIPCRTANRGKFPLNGTYFQANEVFADHSSSRHPISIPREHIWTLPRRTVYFGSSIHSITKDQTRHDIEECFKDGYVCVQGFHRSSRKPMRICDTLHASVAVEKEAAKKEAMKKEGKEAKRYRTLPKEKNVAYSLFHNDYKHTSQRRPEECSKKGVKRYRTSHGGKNNVADSLFHKDCKQTYKRRSKEGGEKGAKRYRMSPEGKNVADSALFHKDYKHTYQRRSKEMPPPPSFFSKCTHK